MMCKFYHECDYASSTAFTCREGGGNYCGKYRLLAFGQSTREDTCIDRAFPVRPGETLV
ncbi:MAG: hypothetical protein PWR29_1394 [Methanolobus sp.]|jgi:hypothetical protein|nr:hypothetical protein [Methanolobus sp.]MDK2912437.1 hypothetical protein [Methanolobus sp.]